MRSQVRFLLAPRSAIARESCKPSGFTPQSITFIDSRNHRPKVLVSKQIAAVHPLALTEPKVLNVFSMSMPFYKDVSIEFFDCI